MQYTIRYGPNQDLIQSTIVTDDHKIDHLIVILTPIKALKHEL